MDAAPEPDQQAEVDLLGLVLGAALQAVAAEGQGATRARHTDQKLLMASRAARAAALAQRVAAALPAGVSADQAGSATALALGDFERNTHAGAWPQAVARSVLLDGLIGDALHRVQLPASVRELLDDEAAPDVRPVLDQVLSDDPSARDEAALYGRRMLGELLSQVQRVATSNAGLAMLLTGADEGADLEAVSGLMAELATSHQRRMAELGLG